MKRLLIAFLFWIGGSAIIYFGGIQLVSLVIYKSFKISFNYNYLFFQGNSNYFLCLTLLSLAGPVYVLLGYVIKTRFNEKYDKKDYSKMTTKHEIKKNMICVSFDRDGNIVLTSWDKLKIMFNTIPLKLNKILKQLKLDNIIKFKTLSQWKIGNETVYKRSGLPFITRYGKVWLDPTPSHSLIVGTTNSGKSYSIILPMLIMMAMSGENGVAIDIKGELSEMTADFFKKNGYKIYFLDFLDTQNSDCWNPLELGIKEYMIQKEIEEKELQEISDKLVYERQKHEILNGNSGIEFDIKTCLGKNEAGDYIYDEKTGNFLTSANYGYAQELFRDVVEAITTDKKSSSNHDSFWDEEAGRVLEGYVHLIVESGKLDCMNIPSISRTILQGDETYRTLGKEKISYVKQYISEYRTANHLSKEKLMSYIDSAENTRKSTRNVLAKHLNSILTNDDVKKILSSNTINLENIGKEKTIIYLKVHDEKQTYYPLVTLFIKQLWQSLVKQARNSPSKSLDIPFNIIFDEMGQFPKFDEIINVLTAGRSRGVRLTSVVQGFDQLEAKYGEKEARTIKNNVMNTVYLLSGDQSTLEDLSKRCGTKIVKENNKNTEKRNLTVDRLKDFKLGEALILRQRMGAFVTKLRPFDKYKYFPSLEKYQLESKPKKNPAYFDIAEEIKKEQLK